MPIIKCVFLNQNNFLWNFIGIFLLCRPYYLPGAIVAAILGIIVDVPIISFVAGCKVPFMLFKGWNRLFHDLIGREGPFLETICVPFAGLAILLWPLAVVGAFLASVIASIFLGVRAGVVTYQVRDRWFSVCLILLLEEVKLILDV